MKKARSKDLVRSAEIPMIFSLKSLKLLRKQKASLQVIADYMEKNDSGHDHYDHLLGLLHVIDHIQDCLVDNGYFTEEQVFGKFKK